MLNIDLKGKLTKLFSMKYSKLVSILLVIAIVATAAITIKNKIFSAKQNTVQRTATVKKGDLSVLVSGSGSIYFANDKKLYSKMGATVTKVNYKEGDQVKSGDVIAEFDDADFQSTLTTNQLNLEQSEMTVQSDNESVSNMTIKAPFSGQVSNIAVSEGNTVQNGGTVLTISDTSKLKLTLTYNAADAAKIKVGQSAVVYISSTMQSTKGTVAYVNNESNVTSVGGKVYSVIIEMSNPGAITSGMTASTDINTSSGVVSSTNTAALSYINTQSVTSKTGGTVEGIYVKENQKVSSGSVLIVMKNDDVIKAQKTDSLKLASTQQSYNQSLKQLENYKIVAPFDGTITTLGAKVGDTVTAGAEIVDVADTSSMEFDIPVDELDIAKLAVGQTANISVDALTDTSTTPLKGEVAKIAVSGTANSGVTTFPVTVKIDNNIGKIKGGMNANADIVVNEVKDTLYVPVEAVTTVGAKSYVWVKGIGGGSSSAYSGFGNGRTSGRTRGAYGSGQGSAMPNGSNRPSGSANINAEAPGNTGGTANSGNSGMTRTADSYYANAIRKEVEVGVNSDTYIEIKSGLSEGEEVILPKQTSAATTSGISMGRSAGNSGNAGSGGNGGNGGNMMGGGF
jgi:HlyD family secretion protein